MIAQCGRMFNHLCELILKFVRVCTIFLSLPFLYLFLHEATKDEVITKTSVLAKAPDDGRKKYENLQTQVESLQTEIMNVQIKYQKELEKLEKENRELRQQYLIMKTNRKTTIGKKIKVSTFWRSDKIKAIICIFLVFFLEISN